MIIKCTECHSEYDAGLLGDSKAIKCKCGEIIVVTEQGDQDSALLFERYVKRLAQEEGVNPVLKGTTWTVMRGSAMIEIVFSPKDSIVLVSSSILPVPQVADIQLKMFARLLSLNVADTGEAKFAVKDDQVQVIFSRSMVGLDYVEFYSGVSSVARVADDYDDLLREEFLNAGKGSEDEDELDLSAYAVK